MPPMFASTYTSWRTGLPSAAPPVTVKCQASLPPRASGRTIKPWPSVLAPLTRDSFGSRENTRFSAAASDTLGVVETDRSVYRVPVAEVTLWPPSAASVCTAYSAPKTGTPLCFCWKRTDDCLPSLLVLRVWRSVTGTL